jgi:hypothetical protein
MGKIAANAYALASQIQGGGRRMVVLYS